MSRRDHESRDLRETRRSLRDSMEYLETRRDENKSLQAPSAAVVGSALLSAAEVGAGAAATGWLAGRFGGTGIGSTGIPLGAVAWAIGQGVALSGVAGKKYSPHIQNVANGALAGYLALWGAGAGGQSRVAANQAPGAIVAGTPHIAGRFQDRTAIGAAPGYPMPAMPFPRQMNGMNPFAPHQPRPLTEAELQGLSRSM